MMEQVTERGGTAAKAGIDHYRVAGKTETARVLGQDGYNDERHVALFAGIILPVPKGYSLGLTYHSTLGMPRYGLGPSL